MRLTKEDLKEIENLLDKKLDDKLDAKLAAQTKELKQFAIGQTEELARIIATSIVLPMNHNFQVIGETLNIVDQLIFEPKAKYKSK